MYIKLFKYSIPPVRQEDFLTLQKEVNTAYQKHAKVEFELLQDEMHPGAWVEIQYYEDKEAYEKAMEGVRSEPYGQALWERFLTMLDPVHPEVEENSFFCHRGDFH